MTDRTMTRGRKSTSGPAALVPLLGLLALIAACRTNDEFKFDPASANYQPVSTKIEYPDAQVSHNQAVQATLEPSTIRDPGQLEPWPLSLQEAVQTALGSSQVMRDLGGRVVTAPQSIATIYDPALRESDPLLGPEAALSAFDAQLNAGLLFDQDDRTFNNFFGGGGAASIKNNIANFRGEISKTAVTGTRFALRNVTDYTRNNNRFNRFSSAYDTVIEGEFRHPLLEGSGIEFNRIAGPQATPGRYNGVLLARINTDVAIADFEASVRDLVRDVERAYWQLYFAYRDLSAKSAGRDAALETWNVVKDKLDAGEADAEREALAREQYFAAQALVEDAYGGASVNGTGGLLAAERTLRRLMGLPSADGRLIRPSDEPAQIDMVFDWNEVLGQSLNQRVELRRQQWNIKRRELEVQAARNFMKMRLDLVGQYRFRGFGDKLLDDTSINNGSAFEDLLGGDLQGWRMGLELSTPIGDRIGHLSVRNAQLSLARERALYREQELQITHEVTTAFTEIDRAYVLTKSNYNRSIAALEQYRAILAKYESGAQIPGEPEILLENVLAAQSRAVSAASAYYGSLVDYNVALMQLHYSKGTLLAYHQVELAEGPWSAAAHRSAAKQSRRFGPPLLNYCREDPCPISRGPAARPALDEGCFDLPQPGTPAVPPGPAVPQPGPQEDSDEATGNTGDADAARGLGET